MARAHTAGEEKHENMATGWLRLLVFSSFCSGKVVTPDNMKSYNDAVLIICNSKRTRDLEVSCREHETLFSIRNGVSNDVKMSFCYLASIHMIFLFRVAWIPNLFLQTNLFFTRKLFFFKNKKNEQRNPASKVLKIEHRKSWTTASQRRSDIIFPSSQFQRKAWW